MQFRFARNNFCEEAKNYVLREACKVRTQMCSVVVDAVSEPIAVPRHQQEQLFGYHPLLHSVFIAKIIRYGSKSPQAHFSMAAISTVWRRFALEAGQDNARDVLPLQQCKWITALLGYSKEIAVVRPSMPLPDDNVETFCWRYDRADEMWPVVCSPTASWLRRLLDYQQKLRERNTLQYWLCRRQETPIDELQQLLEANVIAAAIDAPSAADDDDDDAPAAQPARSVRRVRLHSDRVRLRHHLEQYRQRLTDDFLMERRKKMIGITHRSAFAFVVSGAIISLLALVTIPVFSSEACCERDGNSTSTNRWPLDQNVSCTTDIFDPDPPFATNLSSDGGVATCPPSFVTASGSSCGELSWLRQSQILCGVSSLLAHVASIILFGFNLFCPTSSVCHASRSATFSVAMLVVLSIGGWLTAIILGVSTPIDFNPDLIYARCLAGNETALMANTVQTMTLHTGGGALLALEAAAALVPALIVIGMLMFDLTEKFCCKWWE